MRRRYGLLVKTIAIALPVSAVAACQAGSETGNPMVTACTPDAPPAPPPPSSGPTGGFDKIKHFVVIYMENRSFDNLYGEFPGAEGLANVKDAQGNFKWKQVDPTGVVYPVLPQPLDTSVTPPAPATAFPANLPNEPFAIDKYVTVSDAKGMAMGFYHTAELPMFAEAGNYTLCDHFFHAAFGGSFLNHMWLIAARHPVFEKAPTSVLAQLDAKGNVAIDGFVTPNGCYVVNTAFTVNAPHPSTTKKEQLVPNQTFATIGDRLSDKGLDWAWYSGGWNAVLSGDADASTKDAFQYHHQPFAYFAKYADGTDAKKQHLKDETDFLDAAKSGTLPAVSFVKPVGVDNEHPGYAKVAQGEAHLVSLIDAVRNGPNWADTAIIVTYDENGGQWDHVPPPTTDKNGPGTRVPAIVISPFAKKHFIDSTVYDTTSILATIEHRWGLDPLSSRDAKAPDMANAFDFTAAP